MHIFKLYFLVLSTFSYSIALADYVRTGPAKGEDCTLGVVCKWHTVDAVSDKNNKLHELAFSFNKVSSYDKRKQRCWINTSSGHSFGFLGYAFDAAFRPNFYTLKNGSYKKINFDFITFPCTKR